MIRIICFLLLGLLVIGPSPGWADQGGASDSLSEAVLIERGREIYVESCADCHGAKGQGVEEFYPDALVGDATVGQLAEIVAATMPEGEPELCEGADADAVAAFMHDAFYSPAAQIRNRPPRLLLQRLTASQMRQSYSDLYAIFEGVPERSKEHGVKGQYFDGSRWKKENRRVERIDPLIDFDFGRGSPAEDISAEGFYIHWEGGLKIDRTGRYEIVVTSTCSMTMDFGRGNRKLIDNHVQSGDKTEFRRTLHLTAGRVYPFEIEFIQRKRKTESPPARIRLAWVPPGGQLETIPSRNLVATWVPPAFSLQTQLPPDDRSYGYERGIAVNRQWDEATTSAALEFAAIATDELWPAYRRKHRKKSGDERDKLKTFLAQIVSRAFRGPLSDEDRVRFIDAPIDHTPDNAEAIKRVLLVALKSPRFLYPTLDRDRVAARRAINRLALVLHDSLPTTEWMIEAVQKGEIRDEGYLRSMAKEMVNDYRADAKLHDFIASWLNLSHVGDLAKDDANYPGFDAELQFHLHKSLHQSIDSVLQSPTADYRDLFRKQSTWTSERLAEFYGDRWRVDEADLAQPDNQADKVEEGADQAIGLISHHDTHLRPSVAAPDRLGVLNHPYLMAGLAYHDSSSPIHRGVFLIRYLLGRTLRPPNEAFSPLSPDLHPELTTRQRVEVQTGAESCQVCHAKINPLGFVLENFDAAGRYRETDNGKPVDSSGSYIDLAGSEITFDDASDLAAYLADSDDAARAFVNRCFQHFTKQPPAAYGIDTLDHLTAQFKQNDYNIRRLVVEVATIAALHELNDS